MGAEVRSVVHLVCNTLLHTGSYSTPPFMHFEPDRWLLQGAEIMHSGSDTPHYHTAGAAK